jgi:hypothetical protein
VASTPIVLPFTKPTVANRASTHVNTSRWVSRSIYEERRREQRVQLLTKRAAKLELQLVAPENT